MNLATASSFPLQNHGVTPIATCHWQWVGNILAARGIQNAWEMLGLSWGCRWTGGSVLFGIATWPRLLREISGAEVVIAMFQSDAEARVAELQLNDECVPFIAEIDAYYIPSGHRERAHLVHAVLVVERSKHRACIVDSEIGEHIMEYPINEYELMRTSPCSGRVEGHKLYSVSWAPIVEPEPETILDTVRSHLNQVFPGWLPALERYVEWAENSEEPIDVCRAAGERYQAARLFDYLASRKLEAAVQPAILLNQLTSDWYLVHMLTSHEHIRNKRARNRIVRLMKRLIEAENDLVRAVLG